MQVFPYSSPIILNDTVFVEYGGKTGTFSASQRNASYLVAEIQATNYLGTFLLPINVTGTFPFMGKRRIPTDYGYVHRLYQVNVLSKSYLYTTCDLTANAGCGYIYDDTFGYVDFKQVSAVCGLQIEGSFAGQWIAPNVPYQIQISYQAGLPTGTASLPPVLEALTILAQIDLNEKDPGNAGLNESTGDIAVQSYKSLDYSEERGKHSLVKTALGESAKAMRAKRLLDACIRKARRASMAG